MRRTLDAFIIPPSRRPNARINTLFSLPARSLRGDNGLNTICTYQRYTAYEVSNGVQRLARYNNKRGEQDSGDAGYMVQYRESVQALLPFVVLCNAMRCGDFKLQNYDGDRRKISSRHLKSASRLDVRAGIDIP